MNTRKNEVSFLYTLLISLVTVGLVSCGGGSGADKSGERTASELDKAKKDVANKVEQVLYELPPPSEIPFLLEATGADYDESLPNTLEKADNYLSSEYFTALNLGIYSADIGYLASYEEVQPALNYMQAARSMANNLNLDNTLDEELISRFERNLSNKDSLASIIDEVVERSDETLKQSKREKTAALILAGSYIEGLYLATAIIENYPKDVLPDEARATILVPVIKIVIEEEKTLDDLISLMQSIEGDEQINELIVELQELAAAYDKLQIKEQIEANQGDLLLKDTALDEITNKTGEIRDAITG